MDPFPQQTTSLKSFPRRLECVNDWSIALNNKNSVDVSYIDFSRAFNSVVHSKLLCKLVSYGVRDDLLTWLKAFLYGRQQCVVTNNIRSHVCQILSGVPQGSVVGPLLFLLYVNDVVDIFDINVTCKLYADDLKLYTVIGNSNPASPLNVAHEKLTDWALKWQLSVNTEKCKILHLGKQPSPSVYSLDNTEIQASNFINDLGVDIDSCLKFDHHISRIIARAYQRINLMFRGFVTRDPTFLKQCYVTYVRPILEYCSSVWSPHLLKDVDALERVQKYFTRRVYGLKSFEYKERLFILNLESLEMRRLISDLGMYFKIVHKLIDLDFDDFFNWSPSGLVTRGHSLKLELKKWQSDIYKFSFANRCIRCWNSLPADVVNSSSVNIFMSKIKNLKLDEFLVGRTLVDL